MYCLGRRARKCLLYLKLSFNYVRDMRTELVVRWRIHYRKIRQKMAYSIPIIPCSSSDTVVTSKNGKTHSPVSPLRRKAVFRSEWTSKRNSGVFLFTHTKWSMHRQWEGKMTHDVDPDVPHKFPARFAYFWKLMKAGAAGKKINYISLPNTALRNIFQILTRSKWVLHILTALEVH